MAGTFRCILVVAVATSATCSSLNDLGVHKTSISALRSLGFVGIGTVQRMVTSSSTRPRAASNLQRCRHASVTMSEIPWEPNAKPENSIGYSPEQEARGLSFEAREGVKFLGDLPRQRVFVTATIDCPPPIEADQVRQPSFRMPTNDAVDEVQEAFIVRSRLHRMMHQDIIDAYTGQQQDAHERSLGDGAKLHLKFGNANGFFRRWPQQQYTVTLQQVGNNEFDVLPGSNTDALSAMDVVSLRAHYVSEQRMLKISGFMDGCDINGELRAIPLARSSSQHVY